MSNDWYRISRLIGLSLALVCFCLTGCEDQPGAGQVPSVDVSQSESVESSVSSDPVRYAGRVDYDAEAEAVIKAVLLKIEKGQFDAAEEIIEHSVVLDREPIEQLDRIIEHYRSIEEKREVVQEELYEEHYATFAEWKEKGVPADVNDFEEAFASVLKVRDYASKQQKEALMADSYVQALRERALEYAHTNESEGNWIDAYAQGYYWLKALDKDEQKYKDAAERLSTLMTIEMSLSDNSCETSEERHEGIGPEMFQRAIRALDFNYVSIVDYTELAEKSLKQCELLGVVLAHSRDEIAYQVDDPDAIASWNEGIAAMQEEMAGPLAAVTRDEFLKVFAEVLALNEETTQLPQEVVISQFAQGSMEALDPHTGLVWPWEVKDFQKNITQEFTGIGIEISKATGDLKVISLLPDTPAFRSGLDADDVILAIDGEEVTKDMSIHCAVSKITGPAGSKVRLTVQHADTQKTEDIVITRARIIVPTVKGWQRSEEGDWRFMLDESNGIGYVRLTNFTATTVEKMEKVLRNLERRGMRGLILDLRNNTGGLLVGAAGVADMFIREGLIVKSQPRWGISTYEQAHEKGTHPNYPLVILINGASASASEIVAGALQDAKYRRATLVGERTYGKGSVQTITPFSGDGSQLKYTMAYYHLPSNQRVESRYLMERQGRDDWGIAPDVEVKVRGKELKKMIDVQRANEILARGDREDGEHDLQRYSLEETLDADPQLAVGLLVLKAKMVAAGEPVVLEQEAVAGQMPKAGAALN